MNLILLSSGEAVDEELTRRAEYPSLVAPRLHGEPHQSTSEVLRAMANGISRATMVYLEVSSRAIVSLLYGYFRACLE